MNADPEGRVVVVGGGPGGMMLTHLLGRAGIPVTLLEAHQDFDREFRGDSLHPYTLELCAQLGLAEDLLRLPHQRARYFRLHTPAGTITTADYGRVPSRFNYVALMPQARFGKLRHVAVLRSGRSSTVSVSAKLGRSPRSRPGPESAG